MKRPLFDENGVANQLLGVATDITQRKLVEEALSKERAFIHQVINLCPSEIFVKDERGAYTLVNNATAAAYGTTPEQLTGKRDADFNRYPHAVERYEAEDRHVIESGEDLLIPEQLTFDREGNAHWLQVMKRPIRDEFGKPTHVLGIGVDITSRKIAERELIESREQYRMLAEMCGDGIWQVDREGYTQYLNPAMARLLEVKGIEELQGQTYWEFFDEESSERIRQEEEKRLRGLTSTYDVTLVGSKGTHRNVMITGAPLFGPERELRGFLGTVTDLTERRQEEAEQRAIEERMMQAQKLESLGLLAGGIAHDFNNLLVGILGNAGLALMDMTSDQPSYERVARIRRAARRASDLTNQLLAYSGQSQFISSQFHLSELVSEMIDLLETVISKRARLSFETTARLPSIQGDPTQIRQVVMNLITNASDALNGTGGEIVVRTEARSDEESERGYCFGRTELLREPRVVLEVIDTGCGMNAKTIHQIFDPFFTTKETGNGLGLAAVLGIVGSHHGLIQVVSEPDRGTSIQVNFPAFGEFRLPRSAATSEEATRQVVRNGTVLVVDDEETVREVASRILTRFGFETVTAQNGAEALKLFRAHRGSVSLVLLDLTMPDMSGDEVAHVIRQESPEVPILFSSGYTEQAAQVDSLTSSGCSFIQKPYGPKTLLGKIQALTGAEQSLGSQVLDHSE